MHYFLLPTSTCKVCLHFFSHSLSLFWMNPLMGKKKSVTHCMLSFLDCTAEQTCKPVKAHMKLHCLTSHFYERWQFSLALFPIFFICLWHSARGDWRVVRTWKTESVLNWALVEIWLVLKKQLFAKVIYFKRRPSGEISFSPLRLEQQQGRFFFLRFIWTKPYNIGSSCLEA